MKQRKKESHKQERKGTQIRGLKDRGFEVGVEPTEGEFGATGSHGKKKDEEALRMTKMKMGDENYQRTNMVCLCVCKRERARKKQKRIPTRSNL